MSTAASLATVSLAESYHCCEQLARRSASSFYWSFWLLPREQRRAMCALYAFARHTDDLGDGCGSIADRAYALSQWRASLDAAFDDRPDSTLLPALVDTVRRFSVPTDLLFDIIAGVELDLHHRGFETFAELRDYCYHVASTVGLACLHIWGCHLDEAREPAVTCGIAFQLTNILRDLKEDSLRQRVYLPREDLRQFGYTENELHNGICDDRFRKLIQYQIVRTATLYDEATATRRFLNADGRRAFDMMFHTYRSLLDEIQRRSNEILARRIRLPLSRKLAIVAKSCWAW